MRLTPYGRREILVSLALTGGATAIFAYGGAMFWSGFYGLALFPLVMGVFVVSFFRDPERTPPADENLLVSPADGTVTAVDEVDDPGGFGGRVVRVSIFLSIFNVHLNRAPFGGRVAEVRYRQGEFLNAMNADSAHRNEANDVLCQTDDPRLPRFLVRQVAGLIARRIVCTVGPGDALVRGQRFGMIKFSSRTDLFLPLGAVKLHITPGQSVRAGQTVIGELPA